MLFFVLSQGCRKKNTRSMKVDFSRLFVSDTIQDFQFSIVVIAYLKFLKSNPTN